MPDKLANLRVIAFSLAVVLLADCTRAPESTGDLDVPPPTTRAVLQITSGGGYGGSSSTVTIWEDGTAVFDLFEGAIQVTRLSAGTLARVMRMGSALYGIESRQPAFPTVTDLSTTAFSIDTDLGRKTVSVYGFTPTRPAPEWRDQEQHVEAMAVLRKLFAEVKAALPRGAPLLRPTEISVGLNPMGRHFAPYAEGDWPRDLTGHLNAADAQRALQLAGFGTHLRWIDGDLYDVRVGPTLPILSQPWDEWPQDSLPRHPSALAYTSGRVSSEYYRFLDISQVEVAAWYKSAMLEREWRLADERASEEQIWVRAKYDNDPVIRFRFYANDFYIDRLYGGGVLNHPNQLDSSDCVPACRYLKDVSVEEAESWFRAYLGYVGWVEGAPNVFYDLLARGHRTEYSELRLRFEPAEKGTKVFLTQARAVPPPTGWPSPPAWAVNPLCESTRGGIVKLPGRELVLPESLCVWIQEPSRMRIQVAYGRSYIEFDPGTGRFRTGWGIPGESALFEDLARLSGMAVGFFQWPPSLSSSPTPQPRSP